MTRRDGLHGELALRLLLDELVLDLPEGANDVHCATLAALYASAASR